MGEKALGGSLRFVVVVGVVLLAGMRGGLAAVPQGAAMGALQTAGALYYTSWAYRQEHGNWPETGQQLTAFAAATATGWHFDSHDFCAIRFQRVSPAELKIHFSLVMKQGEQLCGATMHITVKGSEAGPEGVSALIDLMPLVRLPMSSMAPVPTRRPEQSKPASETKRQRFERLYFPGQQRTR